MGTVLRSELSKRNPYWIDKHRFYELKHFCLQYDIWQRAYDSLDGLSKRPSDVVICGSDISDPTEKCAEAREFFWRRIDMLKTCARETDPVIGDYILEAVVTGKSYETLNAMNRIPTNKEYYYDLYRKFFFLLSASRK